MNTQALLPIAALFLLSRNGGIGGLLGGSGVNMRQVGEGVQALGALGVMGGSIYAVAQAPNPGTGAGGALTATEEEQLRKAVRYGAIFGIAGGGVQAIGNLLSAFGR